MPPSIANTRSAQSLVGQTVPLFGLVHSIYRQRKGTFVNFDFAFPNQSLTAIVWNSANIEAGDRICVRGSITTYKGRPQVEIISPSQLVRFEDVDRFFAGQ